MRYIKSRQGFLGESVGREKESLANRALFSKDPIELDRLSWSESLLVRYYVAGNRSARSGTLARLYSVAKDDPQDGPSVIRELAKNPSTPVEILDLLAGSEDSETRYQVSHNPSTPLGTLVGLSGDQEGLVAQAAKRKLQGRDVLGWALGESRRRL